MTAPKIDVYDAPHPFEPLLPERHRLDALHERAADVIAACSAVHAAIAQGPQAELRTLLRKMNSFYTNLIEGEHTRPSEIDRALARDFSGDQDIARKQRLAVAHMQAEQTLEDHLAAQARDPGQQDAWLYSTEALGTLHAALFDRLPDQDLRLTDGSLLVPGRLRDRQVAVGRHEAPLHTSVPAFLERWGEVYRQARRGEATLVAIAASHHRLAWIHPYPDGNGRLCRLHTHLGLFSAGFTKGLWSPLRGFARTQDRYRALLQAADEHRRGDHDGRGNLSQAALIDWIGYVLEVCLDQARFMASRLDTRQMRDRIAACLHVEDAVVKRGVGPAALLPLHHLFMSQTPLPRADFKAMTGLGERKATQLVSDLLREGFLKTDSPYGPVRFGIPNRALRYYFPALWPEAEEDEALGR